MRSILCALLASLLLACSGGTGTSTKTTPPPPPPPPVNPVPVPRATYQARVAPMVEQGVNAPTGSIPATFIVENGGTFVGELDGFQALRGAIYVAPDGAVSLVGTCTTTHPDGTTEPLTLTGTLANGRLTGTSSAGSFDLAVTTIQDSGVDLPSKAGSYRSTASSTGQVIVLQINSTGALSGFAYDSEALANEGKIFTGEFQGSITTTDPAKNCFNIGFSYKPSGSSSWRPYTFGMAYFAADGSLVALTCNPTNTTAGQLAATFARQ